MEFYNWEKTFSYSRAKWVLVISSRGYGKTYGLRKQCVRDYLKKKRRFVEVVRYKSELPDIARGYFDKLQINNEFPGYEFRYEMNRFYMRRCESEEWECIGYIIALTDEQLAKRMTFAGVKRFIFDEGFIEHADRYKRYLPREFERLVGLRSSVTRAKPGDDDDTVVYILGNAVDLTCPYLERLGVLRIPSYGYRVYNDGDVLLHFVPPAYYEEYLKDTVVGRAIAGTKEGDKLFKNEFVESNADYCERMPKGSKFWRAYAFGGHTFALYMRPDNYIHVAEKAPKNARIAAFTLDDDRVDYDLVKRTGQEGKVMREAFFKKMMRYDTPLVRERYADMLISLGLV